MQNDRKNSTGLASGLNDQMTWDNSIKVSKLEQGQKDLGRNLDSLKETSKEEIANLSKNTQKGFDEVKAQLSTITNRLESDQSTSQERIRRLEDLLSKQDARLAKVEDAVQELKDVNGKLRSIETRLGKTEKEVDNINTSISEYKKSHYQSKISIIIAIISAIGAIAATLVSCLLK